MNYEDEPYFRFYTRDTKTFLSLGLEGQSLIGLIGRKLDRAGVLDDIDDPVEDVAIILHTDQVEFVRKGMVRLLSKGVLVHRGKKLIMPNYIKAQTASKSDRQRAKDYRDKRRAEALLGVTASDDSVTECDVPESITFLMPKTNGVTVSNPIVTGRDGSSQDVTPESRSSQVASPMYLYPDHCALPLEQTHVELPPSQPDAKAAERKRLESERVSSVFRHWQEVHRHPKAKLDRKRASRISARLRDGFSVENLKLAISNARNDPHLMGQSGTVYDGIDTLLRDVAQVERLVELDAPKRPSAPRPISRQPDSNYDFSATEFTGEEPTP